ncbi:hypothetical protein [Sphingobium nicotianae]|uniref:DUF2946 domain-containing protein n=1 Tax=Sphingobium nicotianae TaxID=2782607 RepID=A0A9X1AI59_9SPHN|nr:hypothetical protein [Sphingobium nicotianae]MBT2185637.1 hypothetical protein [Sphingobium nicotianae]
MPRTLRLVWMLAMLLLALPAMQANACMPAAIGHGARAPAMHHGHHKPQAPAAVHHDCIGCVAPIDTDTGRPVARLSYAWNRAPVSALATFSPNRAAPPEPPPPRQSV